MRIKLGAVLALALASCVVGQSIDNYEPARRANGSEGTISVEVADATVSRVGELIAVRERDFLLLTTDGLERIPHAAVREAEFPDARPASIRRAGTSGQRRGLARYSRYPLGLEGEPLDALLTALGQSALIEVVR